MGISIITHIIGVSLVNVEPFVLIWRAVVLVVIVAVTSPVAFVTAMLLVLGFFVDAAVVAAVACVGIAVGASILALFVRVDTAVRRRLRLGAVSFMSATVNAQCTCRPACSRRRALRPIAGIVVRFARFRFVVIVVGAGVTGIAAPSTSLSVMAFVAMRLASSSPCFRTSLVVVKLAPSPLAFGISDPSFSSCLGTWADSSLIAVRMPVSAPWVSEVVTIMFVESAAPTLTSATRPVSTPGAGVLTTVSCVSVPAGDIITIISPVVAASCVGALVVVIGAAASCPSYATEACELRLGAAAHTSLPPFVVTRADTVGVSRIIGDSSAALAITVSSCYGSRRPTPALTTAGVRDKASATTFVAPGRCSTASSYFCSTRGQRCRRPARFGRVMSQFKAGCSVMIVNALPYKCGRNIFTDQTTARHASSFIELFDSATRFLLLPYAIGCQPHP
ncbi:unnamed protein product [Phytophthora fragariaefolia]|uniref:Unnamed protein product n=1 Tax=Phytophthora fragariaefolia TaxID=1490495 RepID=A0A9W6XG19_9STRA|nr:unnamed protein product [Phytophthora fragariaefolia]